MTDPHAPCPNCGYPMPSPPCPLCEGTIRSVDGLSNVQPGRRFFVTEVIEGFTSLFSASLLLMTKKEYMGKLGMAMLVNFVLVLVFAGGAFWGFWEIFESLLQSAEDPDADTWGNFFRGLFAGGAALFSAVLCVWFLSPALIETGMAPFLDPLANATEKMLAGEQMQPVDLGFWKGLMTGLNAAAQILILQIFILVPVLLLGLIPVVGQFFAIFGVLISAYLNAIVWFEIPAVRRGYGMKYRKRIVRKNWGRALGFGLAFYLGMLVPIFNLLFLGPAAAVAVSLLYLRFEKQT